MDINDRMKAAHGRIDQRKQQEVQQILQQQQLAEQRRIMAQQQQRLQQQQLYNELKAITTAVGAQDWLGPIRQNVWRCGEIEPYQGQYTTSKTLPTGYDDLSLAHVEKTYYMESGFRLHFEYEVLHFVRHGGYQSRVYGRDGATEGVWTGPESKELVRSTSSVILQITAQENITNGPNGNRHLGVTEVRCLLGEFEKRRNAYHIPTWSFPIVPGDLTALTQQLDECLYLYSQETDFPQALAAVAQKNRQEEESYRNYKLRQRESGRGWFG